MAETWDADKKYHVAMAIMTGIMRNNRPHMSWLNFEWQEIADMLNKAKNYGLTADAVRHQFFHVMVRGFLEDVGPDAVIPSHSRSSHVNHDNLLANNVTWVEALLRIHYAGVAENRPKPNKPQQHQPQPQATASTAKGAGEEGKAERRAKFKVTRKRKADDEPSGSDAVVKKARRDADGDDDGAAAGGLESSRS